MFWRVPEDCGAINTPVLIVIGNKDPQVNIYVKPNSIFNIII